VNKGGIANQQGTWAHPLVAIAFAQWISPQFHIWCNKCIKIIFETGSYSVSNVKSEPIQQPIIPVHVVALEKSRAITEIDNSLSNKHPRLAQLLIDHIVSDLIGSEKLLNGDRLRGVVEIAEAMGFKNATIKRCNLGKYVKRLCGHLASQEERLVHGTMRAVACYPENNEEVKTAIFKFFN
jgi:hypothetical protein